MINYAQIVGDSAEHVLSGAFYDENSFARFSVGNQPLITLVSARLAIDSSFADETSAFLLTNAKEELSGAYGEGPHSILATKFFSQVVTPLDSHREKVNSYVDDVQREDCVRTLISFMATVEAWSIRAMPLIGQAMVDLGAVNMEYINAHLQVDGGSDGHSAQFTESLHREEITDDELHRGTEYFKRLFGAIFFK